MKKILLIALVLGSQVSYTADEACSVLCLGYSHTEIACALGAGCMVAGTLTYAISMMKYQKSESTKTLKNEKAYSSDDEYTSDDEYDEYIDEKSLMAVRTVIVQENFNVNKEAENVQPLVTTLISKKKSKSASVDEYVQLLEKYRS